MMSTLKVIAFETERITVNNKMFMGYQKYLEEFIKIFYDPLCSDKYVTLRTNG